MKCCGSQKISINTAIAGYGLQSHSRDYSCITSTHVKHLCLRMEENLFNIHLQLASILISPKTDKVEKEKQGWGRCDGGKKNLEQYSFKNDSLILYFNTIKNNLSQKRFAWVIHDVSINNIFIFCQCQQFSWTSLKEGRKKKKLK